MASLFDWFLYEAKREGKARNTMTMKGTLLMLTMIIEWIMAYQCTSTRLRQLILIARPFGYGGIIPSIQPDVSCQGRNLDHGPKEG